MSLLSDLAVPAARKSEGIVDITEDEYIRRFEKRFIDPYFDAHRTEIHELAKIAFRTHKDGRKAPIQSRAGPGYNDPDYMLADEWRQTKTAIEAAQKRHQDPKGRRRVLLISGADRNDKTCPGEVSKSRRLAQIAQATLEAEYDFDIELLDLSLMISEFGKTIYPCKGCVSTAMPLCHWPCSCYPNYSLGQADDWMNEIYPKFAAAHGIMIVTPVYWYQAPSGLKLLIDRLVCSDGGNTDPSTTHGKKTDEAKKLEAAGWDYPKHLEKRIFGCVVHGDAGGANEVKNALTEWAKDLHMIPASNESEIARYIGYYGPYYKSHVALDEDEDVQEETRNVARSIAKTVRAQLAGLTSFADPHQKEPRAK